MKVIFILNLFCNPNSIKRIEEFKAKGYDVEAYGFDRKLGVVNVPENIDMKVIGEFSNSMPYSKRIPILYLGIKKVLENRNTKECLYYLVGLEVALCFLAQKHGRYIYEEADLVQTVFNNKILERIFEVLDKMVIRMSVVSVFRSEGFLKYHFKEKVPSNVYVIPNRLNPSVGNLSAVRHKDIDINKLKIGFVGFIRYKSIFNFAKVFCNNFPLCEFHFYGTFTTSGNEKLFSPLKELSNCFFHGKFTSPDDLPSIYSQIDLVLSAYDITSENVRYAESNKIYEAIFFETPIIVTSGTYVAEKVKKLGIGYAIEAMNDNEIVCFINNLTKESLDEKKECMRRINKRDVINVNDQFFEKLNNLLKG